MKVGSDRFLEEERATEDNISLQCMWTHHLPGPNLLDAWPLHCEVVCHNSRNSRRQLRSQSRSTAQVDIRAKRHHAQPLVCLTAGHPVSSQRRCWDAPNSHDIG